MSLKQQYLNNRVVANKQLGSSVYISRLCSLANYISDERGIVLHTTLLLIITTAHLDCSYRWSVGVLTSMDLQIVTTAHLVWQRWSDPPPALWLSYAISKKKPPIDNLFNYHRNLLCILWLTASTYATTVSLTHSIYTWTFFVQEDSHPRY